MSKVKSVSMEDVQELLQAQLYPAIREILSGQLTPLYGAFCKIVDALEIERKKKLNMQTFIGESVLTELLQQSYGIPEYTTEESSKRIISAVEKAIRNYSEIDNNSLLNDHKNSIMDSMWNRPEDPHTLHIEKPDPTSIHMRVKEKPRTDSRDLKDILNYIFPEEPVIEQDLKKATLNLDQLKKLGIKPTLQNFKKAENPDLTQLWKHPSQESANDTGPGQHKTIYVQINGQSVGAFRYNPEMSDTVIHQKVLDIAIPILKRRKRKVKEVIRDELTWNLVI